MVTSRRIRWFVAFVGVLVCALAYGLIRGQAQSANQAFVESSTCSSALIKWNDKPADHIPTTGGLVQLFCPWQSYTWISPLYLMDENGDWWFVTRPASLADIPDSGNNWGQCLISGYIRYTINSIAYHKTFEYPTGYDGYLDCELKKLPMIMNYGPRLYQVYDPYPGPGEDSMSGGGFLQEESQSIFTIELDSPYP